MLALRFDNALQRADLVREGGNLLAGDPLEVAIVISLFSDAAATLDDGRPERRGWWGDAYASVEGDRVGSRLWQLWRQKASRETLALAAEYAEAALGWLVEDGVATAVRARAEFVRPPAGGALQLRLDIEVERPDGTTYRWSRAWEVHSAV